MVHLPLCWCYSCLISELCLHYWKEFVTNDVLGSGTEKAECQNISEAWVLARKFLALRWAEADLQPRAHVLVFASTGISSALSGLSSQGVLGAWLVTLAAFFFFKGWFWEVRSQQWALRWANNYSVCIGKEMVSLWAGGCHSVCFFACDDVAGCYFSPGSLNCSAQLGSLEKTCKPSGSWPWGLGWPGVLSGAAERLHGWLQDGRKWVLQILIVFIQTGFQHTLCLRNSAL